MNMKVTGEGIRNIRSLDAFKEWEIQGPSEKLISLAAHFLGYPCTPKKKDDRRDLVELLILEKLS